MAEGVVRLLEAVEVHEDQREEIVVPALEPRERVAEPLGEERAVGQAREGIVGTAVGDVGLRPRHAVRPPGAVADGEAAAQEPAVAPVLVPHAVLVLEVGRGPVEVGRPLGLQAGQIVGVDAVQPFRRPVADLVLFVAQHGLPAR